MTNTNKPPKDRDFLGLVKDSNGNPWYGVYSSGPQTGRVLMVSLVTLIGSF